MQEVYHNGTKGEIKTADTLEKLLPEIKKSLENPDVKYVKVFYAKDPVSNDDIVKSEEERKNILDHIAEQKE